MQRHHRGINNRQKNREVIYQMYKKNNSDTPGVSGIRGLSLSAIMLISLVALVIVGTTNTVALDPHVFSGTIYDQNGTVVDNDTVTVLNVRTGESANTTGNATGIYAYNLLNLPSGWAYGDTIQITAYNGTQYGVNSTQILLGETSTSMDIWIGTTTEVSGVTFYILDDDGYPVDGALVNIKDSSGDIVTTKMTGSNGRASETLDDGLYTLTISKSGFDDKVQLARVHGTSTYSIRLGEEEGAGIALTDWTYWALILLACIGIIAILLYITKVIW